MKTKSSLILLLCIVTAVVSCTKSMDSGKARVLALPENTPDYNDPAPGYLSDLNNSIDDDLAQLGRVLFYDESLSANSRVSCASCHKQQLAFSDGEKVSSGFALATTSRNSMSIVNTARKNSFFWDGRANSIQQQVLMPITNHIEMGIGSMERLIDKINTLDYYKPLVQAATGQDNITSDIMASALSSFTNSIKSFHSPFDEAMIESGSFSIYQPIVLPPDLKEGFDLFVELGCRNCHGGSDFGGASSGNIGLDLVYADNGIGDITKAPSDYGVFKVPTLRNVELTGPYMHDGRFKTLEEVVEHYNSGIQGHPNLSYPLTANSVLTLESFLANGGNALDIFNGDVEEVLLQDKTPRRMNLTDQQKASLIHFLKSLTDKTVTSDTRFSDPFVLVDTE